MAVANGLNTGGDRAQRDIAQEAPLCRVAPEMQDLPRKYGRRVTCAARVQPPGSSWDAPGLQHMRFAPIIAGVLLFSSTAAIAQEDYCPANLSDADLIQCRHALTGGYWETWVCEHAVFSATDPRLNACVAQIQKSEMEVSAQREAQQRAAQDAQQQAIQAQRRQNALDMMRLGAGMMAGAQAPIPHTYILNGNAVTCVTTGGVTSCN